MSRRSPRTAATRVNRETRVDGILAVARDVLAEGGYENNPVHEIASRLGVVEGTVYNYFETKRDLLLRVLESWYEGMLESYERNLAGIVDIRERLRFLIYSHAQAIIRNPALAKLMFGEVRSGNNYYETRLHALNRRYTRLLTSVVQEGIDAGRFRRDLEVGFVRDMIYGGIEHNTFDYVVAGRKKHDAQVIADTVLSFVVNGIRAGEHAQEAEAFRRLEAVADRLERIKGGFRDRRGRKERSRPDGRGAPEDHRPL
jgi:AcrR family transcriptional regulator